MIPFHHQVGQQLVVDQRPAHIGARLVDIPAVTVGGVAEGIGGRSLGLLPGLAQDDVDHPTQRICAVERGDGAADHFDTLDGRHGDGGEIEIIAITGGKGVAGADAPAIDQQQGVIPLQPAQLDLAAAVAGSRADIDLGSCFKAPVRLLTLSLSSSARVTTETLAGRSTRYAGFWSPSRPWFHERQQAQSPGPELAGQKGTTPADALQIVGMMYASSTLHIKQPRPTSPTSLSDLARPGAK